MVARALGFGLALLCVAGPAALAGTQRDVDLAARGQKVAFILVTDQGATGVEEARALIRQTLKQVPFQAELPLSDEL